MGLGMELAPSRGGGRTRTSDLKQVREQYGAPHAGQVYRDTWRLQLVTKFAGWADAKKG